MLKGFSTSVLSYILLSAFLVWLVAGIIFIISLATIKQTSLDSLESADAIIALTGSKDRIRKGIDLLDEGKAKTMLITGVHVDFRKDDLKDIWNKRDKLPCCISLGYEARDTIGNAIETKKWIEQNPVDSVILVTSKYHIARSAMIFKTLLPHITIHPYPVSSYPTSLWNADFWRISFKEYNKTLLTWLEIQLL